MDFLNMFQEMQQKLKDTQHRLNDMTVEAEAGEGKVKVTFSGGRELKNIHIHESLLEQTDKEELEDLVLIAVNRGIKKAEEMAGREMKEATGGMLPNIPGLFS